MLNRLFFNIFLFSASCIMLFSCTSDVKDCYSYDYGDCNSVSPSVGTMIIKLSINDENPKVLVKVFKGNYDSPNPVLCKSDSLDDELWRVDLPVNEFYSVAAYYKVKGKTVIAIDGDRIKVDATVKCDSNCYTLHDGHADVKLLK